MGKWWKQCQTLVFWAPKSLQMVTAAMKIKRRLLVGRKVMTNLDSILKSRDITLPTRVCLVKAKIFPVVMYGCESWTIRKAEGRRIDAFELWYWRRLLGVPWTARRSSQSILKETSPELEGLMLKLKLQYFGHLRRRADSFEKTVMLGKIRGRRRGDDRGWDGWMASLTRWKWVWVGSGSWWWTGRPCLLQFMWSQRVRHDWATELNWCLYQKKSHSSFYGYTLCVKAHLFQVPCRHIPLHLRTFSNTIYSPWNTFPLGSQKAFPIF